MSVKINFGYAVGGNERIPFAPDTKDTGNDDRLGEADGLCRRERYHDNEG